MINPLGTTYVDAALEQLRRLDLMRRPGIPPDEMRNDSIPPSGDWIGWKPIPSKVTDTDVDSLEHETKLAFPPLYRDFLKYQHFATLTETGIRFEPHMCHNWRDQLRHAYFQSWPREHILDQGLLPFGDECFIDAGSVCFDTRFRLPDGDCPVVFWDHEWRGTKKEINPMFSSTAKMFECLTLVAQTDIGFVHHDREDDNALLPEKRKCLQHFLDTDPLGAGGPAKEYWTAWGVFSASASHTWLGETLGRLQKALTRPMW